LLLYYGIPRCAFISLIRDSLYYTVEHQPIEVIMILRITIVTLLATWTTAAAAQPGYRNLFNNMAGIKGTHVSYKRTGPMVSALVAGGVVVRMPNIRGVWPMLRAGKLKAMGVSSAKGTAFALELPTIADMGVPGFESGTWYGFTSPRGTPLAAISVLNREMFAALKADVREKLAVIGE
jgi:tripartite-type tricarboxylate transporter receptor subunit TctC